MELAVWTMEDVGLNSKLNYYVVGSVYNNGTKYYRLIPDIYFKIFSVINSKHVTSMLSSLRSFEVINSKHVTSMLSSLRSFEVAESCYEQLKGEYKILNSKRGIEDANCLLEDGSNLDKTKLYKVTQGIIGACKYSLLVDMQGNLYADSQKGSYLGGTSLNVDVSYCTPYMIKHTQTPFYFLILLGRMAYLTKNMENFELSYYYLVCKNLLKLWENTGNSGSLSYFCNSSLSFYGERSATAHNIYTALLGNITSELFKTTSLIYLSTLSKDTRGVFCKDEEFLTLNFLSLLPSRKMSTLSKLDFYSELVYCTDFAVTKRDCKFIWLEKPVEKELLSGSDVGYKELHTILYLAGSYFAPSVTLEAVVNLETGVVYLKNIEVHKYGEVGLHIGGAVSIQHYGSTYKFLTGDNTYEEVHEFTYGEVKKKEEGSEGEFGLLDKFKDKLLALGYVEKRSIQPEYVYFDEFKSLWISERDFISVKSYLPDTAKTYEYRMDLFHDGEFYTSIFGNFTKDALNNIKSMITLDLLVDTKVSDNTYYTSAIEKEVLDTNIYLAKYSKELFYVYYASKYIKLDISDNGVVIAKFLPTGEICICYKTIHEPGNRRHKSVYYSHGISKNLIKKTDLHAVVFNNSELPDDYMCEDSYIIIFAFKTEQEAFDAFFELFLRKRKHQLGKQLRFQEVADFYSIDSIGVDYYSDTYYTDSGVTMDNFISTLLYHKITQQSISGYLSSIELSGGMFEKLVSAWRGESVC